MDIIQADNPAESILKVANEAVGDLKDKAEGALSNADKNAGTEKTVTVTDSKKHDEEVNGTTDQQ